MSESRVLQANGDSSAQQQLAPEPTAEFFETLATRQTAFPPPRPTPIPAPMSPQGSRFRIWKQDPSVSALGLRISYVPELILSGPRDLRINTELPGTTPVNPNTNGDFIFRAGTPEQDSAHAYAVVRQTLAMYERALGGRSIRWAWNRGGNTDVITVFPRAGMTANAFYSRSQKALKFFYFTPSGATDAVFTCRSLDIVAHEVGHAILDGLKPGWLGLGNPPQTGGLHESFGDLTSIFLALSQLDQVEAIVGLTKADLHKSRNFLASVAEQFGDVLGRPMGLRNADNDLKLSQVSNEVHAISQVFTGGIYDILADIYAFEGNRQLAVKDPAQILLEVGHHLCGLVLNAIIQAPAAGATYADVINKMLAISQDQGDPPIYRTFIRSRFTLREVVISPVPLIAMARGEIKIGNPEFTEGEDLTELEGCDHASLYASQDRTGCCGTMQLPEYVLGDQNRLESGEVVTEGDLLAGELEELKRDLMADELKEHNKELA